MKRKYKFEKDLQADSLAILESGEVDPATFLNLYAESLSLSRLQEAAKAGAEKYTETIRTKNFFPAAHLANKLYEQSYAFLFDDETQQIVVEYDDAEALPMEPHIETIEDEEEEEEVEIDSLLKDDKDTDLQEDEIKEIDAEDDTPRFQPDDDSEHEN